MEEQHLSETPKKPGVRDISDLKARLGLKKSGGAAPAAGPKGAAIPPPGAPRAEAVPAPPGVAPPPGAEPPPPQQPPVPDASEDPFGAMSAMASQQARTAAPDIVVAHDAGPAEKIEEGSAVAKYGKLLALIIIPLGLGWIMGGIGQEAASFNETLDDAGLIEAKVKTVNSDLQNLRNVLYDNKVHGPQGNAFQTADSKLVEALESLALTPLPDLQLEQIYNTKLYSMKPEVVNSVFIFVTEYQKLRQNIKAHVDQSKNDAKSLAGAEKRQKLVGAPSGYGVILDVPTADEAGKPVAARFVELGAPVCADGRPNPAGCGGAPPMGFQYRQSADGPFGTKKIAVPSGSGVEGDTIVLMRWSPTEKLQTLFAGADASVAAKGYDLRMVELEALTDKLLDLGKSLGKELQTTSNVGRRFTFFR